MRTAAFFAWCGQQSSYGGAKQLVWNIHKTVNFFGTTISKNVQISFFMRNSEPQTGDVKIGLLSIFHHFFLSLWNSPHYHFLSIFYHLWIDSSNVVLLLILPFAFVQL